MSRTYGAPYSSLNVKRPFSTCTEEAIFNATVKLSSYIEGFYFIKNAISGKQNDLAKKNRGQICYPLLLPNSIRP